MRILDKSVELALKLHHNRRMQQHNLYCFIYDGRKLLSVGYNNMLTVSKKAFDLGKRFNVQKFMDFPYVHAEVNAISRLWGRHYITGKEKMVVIRLGANFDFRLAKPCPSCQEILNALNLSCIYYSDNKGKFLCV